MADERYFHDREEKEIAMEAQKEGSDLIERALEELCQVVQQFGATEQQIASDRLRQATLEAYYDWMTDLLLDHNLRSSAEDSEARNIARARTVAVVKDLDGKRNRKLIAFLKDLNLIDNDASIINLSGENFRNADLSGVDLRGVVLNGADLRGVDLSGADLSGAHLFRANLGGANLRGAILRGADLEVTDLTGTDLYGADLWGADLCHSRCWTFAQLERAKSLESAVMPDGELLWAEDNPNAPSYDEWKVQYEARLQLSLTYDDFEDDFDDDFNDYFDDGY